MFSINRIFSFVQGSCCSSSFGNNISNYVIHMLDLVDMVTQPGSLTYEVMIFLDAEEASYSFFNLIHLWSYVCDRKCKERAEQMSILHSFSRPISYCPIPRFGRESDTTSKIEFALPVMQIVFLIERKEKRKKSSLKST